MHVTYHVFIWSMNCRFFYWKSSVSVTVRCLFYPFGKLTYINWLQCYVWGVCPYHAISTVSALWWGQRMSRSFCLFIYFTIHYRPTVFAVFILHVVCRTNKKSVIIVWIWFCKCWITAHLKCTKVIIPHYEEETKTFHIMLKYMQ